MEVKKRILGIDIGNGFGFASVLLEKNQDPLPMIPAQYKLNQGMPTTAYVTPPTGSPIEVFHPKKGSAEKMVARKPECGIFAVKTRLHEEYVKLKEIEKPVSLDEVYSAVARDMIILANEEMKNKGLEPVYDIVLTFPASFADNLPLLNRMTQSVEKIRIEGHPVHIVGKLPEPAAVAIDYLYYMQHVAPESIRIKEEQFTVLVYDLGHGTFDAAVVTASSKNEPYKVWSKEGLPDVGGKDFDKVLYEEICQILKERYDYVPRSEREKEALRQEAVKVKHDLTDNKETSINPMVRTNELVDDIVISRQRFEELIQGKIVRTLELTQRMIEDAVSEGIKIDAIVLSGGSSRIPIVQNALKEIANKIPILLYRPSEAVSFGAARYALGIRKPKPIPKLVPDTAPVPEPDPDTKENEQKMNRITAESNTQLEQFTEYKYGIFQEVNGQLEGTVSFLLNQGEKLPVTSKEVLLKSLSSQIQIKVFRSKEKKFNKTEELPERCHSIQWFKFDVPKETICKFTITIEEDGNVVVCCLLPDGKMFKKSTAD